MPTNQLYHTWIQQICELRPEQRITQVRNFALLMYGIYQSRSVYLSPYRAKTSSEVFYSRKTVVFVRSSSVGRMGSSHKMEHKIRWVGSFSNTFSPPF